MILPDNCTDNQITTVGSDCVEYVILSSNFSPHPCDLHPEPEYHYCLLSVVAAIAVTGNWSQAELQTLISRLVSESEALGVPLSGLSIYQYIGSSDYADYEGERRLRSFSTIRPAQ